MSKCNTKLVVTCLWCVCCWPQGRPAACDEPPPPRGVIESALVAVDAASGREKALCTLDGPATMPVAVGRLLLLATSRGVAAVEPTTGRIIWRAEGIGPVNRPPAICGGVACVLKCVDFPGVRGSYYGLDVATGRRLWSHATKDYVGITAPGAVGRAFVVGVRSAADSSKYALHALDARTGRRLWAAEARDEPKVILGTREGVVYVECFASYGGFDLESGRRVWRYRPRRAGSYVSEAVCLSHPTLYLVDSVGNDQSVDAVDIRTGRRKWSRPLTARYLRVAGDLVLCSVRDRLHALDAKTGKTLWAFQEGRSYAAVVGDSAFCANLRGDLFCLDRGSGRLKWTASAPGPGWRVARGRLCVVGNTLYLVRGRLGVIRPDGQEEIDRLYWP